VSSPRAKLGGMAPSTFRTPSWVTGWKPSRLSETWYHGGGPFSGKKACRSTCALSSKLVTPLIVASDAGGLGSAFLTLCQWEDGFVFSTTVFQ